MQQLHIFADQLSFVSEIHSLYDVAVFIGECVPYYFVHIYYDVYMYLFNSTV